MQKLYREIELLVSQYDARIVDSMMWDLVYTDPNNDFIQSYAASYRKIAWKEVKIEKEHGASDGRYFASKWMPLLLQRPTCANIHSKNEWVDLESATTLYEVYKHFIFENSFWK